MGAQAITDFIHRPTFRMALHDDQYSNDAKRDEIAQQ